MKTELVNRREDLNGLAKPWDALANTDPRDGFFRTSGWYLSWLDHVRPDAKPFVIVVRDDNGEILGLAPLCQAKHQDRWIPMKAVSIGGREIVSGDFLDYLAVPHARDQVLSAILDFLWKQCPEWELMMAGELMEGGDLHRTLEAFADRNRIPLRQQERRLCPYIELPATFDDYLATFSKKRRHEVRRQMRVLLEKQGAQVEICSDPKEVAEKLDFLIELHVGRWNRANQSGNMHRTGFVQFLKSVCSAPPEGAHSRLFLLHHEGNPVAALLIFYSGQSAFLYSMGWNSESPIANLSPGAMLVMWSIEDAIQRGIRYYDFLRGDEKYKSTFTKTTRQTITLMAARGLSATMYLRALGFKDAVKQRFPMWWDRLVTSREQRLTGQVSGNTVDAAVNATSDASV